MSRLNRMSEAFKSVSIGIKAFLHRQRWKEALIFSCFVLLSFGFWVLQSLQGEYETDLSIPIRYVNVPAYLTFDSELPKSIDLHVRDKGSALLNYSVEKRMRTINIDLSKLSTDKNEYVVGTQFLQSEIQQLLLATTKLYSFRPQRLTLNYGLRSSKDVPVMFDGEVQTPGGFLLSGDISTMPAMVTIYGSQKTLDTINCVKTVHVEVKKAKKTITKDVALKSIPGVTMHTESVSVIIPVEEYTEKSIDIPVRITGVPDIYTVRTFPQSVTVSCNIPISKFKELTQELVAVDLPFKMLEENVSGTLNVDLSSKPKWVKSYSIAPKRIEFLLEVKGNVK
ncbi:MAG TPA: hypothetical protein DDZ04_06290 [Parabacteroides sp.]|nr:hypothetical protein [Parabacteroides sp.]